MKPTKPLGPFCSILNHLPSFLWLHQQCLPIVTHCWARLSGVGIASTSEILPFATVEWLKLRDCK
jgi:hypothetical protein